MAIRFKFDVLEALKEKGFTTYKLRKDGLLSESTIQKLRNGQMVAVVNIDTICHLLCCQPGDILEYIPDEKENLQL